MMDTMKKLLGLLVVFGAINWGLVGAFEYNLADDLLSGRALEVLYVVIGIGGLIAAAALLTDNE